MKNPCHGCNDRNGDCHAKCEKYAEWKKEHDILKAQELKQKTIEQAMIETVRQRKDRINKYLNNKSH